MTPLVPIALTCADLPIAELSGARLDGELFALAGSWCPVDAIDSPTTRAAALAGPAARATGRRVVAERMTAAWIYGLSPEPAQHQFCVDVTARTTKPQGPNDVLREVRLSPTDIRLVGRLLVTEPRRTAVDLARWGCSPGVRADTELLAALLSYDGRSERDTREPPTLMHGISFSRVAADELSRASRRLKE